MMYHDGMVDSM